MASLGQWGSAAGGVIGGITDFFSSKASAKGDKASAASLYKIAAQSQLATKMKLRQADREIYKVVGGGKADVAANGLLLTGSAADAIRASSQQGGLQKALLAAQGKMEYESYIGQAQAASASAKSKKKGGIGSLIGSVASAAITLSDDRLKTDIQLLHRRRDGIGVYLFKYLGDGHTYLGVMADEVEKCFPDAVTIRPDGFKSVHYDMIQADFRRVA